MREISDATLNDLAAKLDGLELDDDQQAVLDKVFERATDGTPETSGFVASEDELIAVLGVHDAGLQVAGDGKIGKPPGLSPMAFKLGSGAGLWP